MNSMSLTRTHFDLERAMPIDAAVPSTTEITVVQIAITRLFQAARRIWSASSSAMYQRKEKPGGGNLSDSDEVSDVIRTMMVGAIRKTMAKIAAAANATRSEAASQSMACLGAGIGLAPPPQRTQNADDDQHRNHEDHRNRGRERPVVGADRLLVNMQRHIDQT